MQSRGQSETATNHSVFFLLLVLATLLATGAATAGPSPHPARNASIPAPAAPAPVTPNEARTRRIAFSFKDFGLRHPIKLLGIDGSDALGFGLRREEVVVAAVLHLDYQYSPSLLADLSHLKLYLNEEVVGTVPLPKDQGGSQQRRDIPIDARYFSDFNQLRLQLIGHYTLACEDALHSSLWAEVSPRSELEFQVSSIVVPDELASLPAPFFDFRDNRPLDLPFVFGPEPDLSTLRAAGMLASWFGALADYRTARFPALLDQSPERHAIVWATNASRPRFLDLPPTEGPSLAVMPHPNDHHIKLLVISGVDAADLEIAARALVIGEPGLSGRRAAISAVRMPPRRAAYDAPRWLPSHRPVKFGELVQTPADLEVRTRIPRVIGLRIRLAPDLLIWQNEGIPLAVHYRYTPPVTDDNSTLNIGVNDTFLRSLSLPAADGARATDETVLPLRDDAGGIDHADVRLPAFQLRTDNELQFQFTFDYHKQGLCRSFQLDNVRAAVDPDSTIDVSALPHYAELPDLAAFAHAGFPFTKYADLAETTVVLPEPPTVTDIEATLALLGHFGRSTGNAALRFGLIGEGTVDAAADTDLLLIDTGARSSLLSRWREHLPVTLAADTRTIGNRAHTWAADRLYDSARPDDTPPRAQTTVSADGPLAVFLALESPLSRGRSAVALVSNAPDSARHALEALADPGRGASIRGDTTYVRGDQVEGFRVGGTYFVGHLPVWTWTWFHVARHPLWLALAGIIAGFLAALLAYGGLKRVARKRLAR